MKKKLLALIPFVCVLTSCNFINPNNPNGGFDPRPIDDADEHTPGEGIDEDEKSGEEIEVEIDPDEEEVEVTDSNKITDLTVEGISYDDTNKVFTITQAGEFTFSGEFNGNILVNAGEEDKVKLVLNGFTIKSSTQSPILCTEADKLQISVKKGSKNYIYDYREKKDENNEDKTQGNGAITADADVEVSGKGSLFITAKYNNGIHTKKDLDVTIESYENSSLQIESYNNCLKGNDSVNIENGKLVLISTGGNGIMSENTDVSSKGNQRGNINITGGQVDIYSAKDAIDAAYNAEISAAETENEPVINIYTNKYSQYTGEVASTSQGTLYLRVSSTVDTSNYYFGVEFLTSDYYTSWEKATLVTSTSGGGGGPGGPGGGYNSNKYLKVNIPSKATSFKVCSFANTVTTMSEDNAYAKMSSYQTINSYYDTAKLSVSGTTISVSGWTNYTSSQPGGGMQEGNNEKADVSAKGIKASNEIKISAGKIFIKAYDDALHANYGDALENDATGVGDVTISGGTLDLYASDDGLHADHKLSITGGTIDIKYSYEGIEGNIIDISGGYTKVYSVDDGLNAANKSGVTPSITVSGGIVDVTVYGQDVDGIDSNGSFTQKGGYVITKGGNSQMSTGLDVDGTASISGGTFVAFGRTEKTPSKGTGITSYTLSGSYSSGNYNVTFADSTSVVVTTKYSYSIIYVYSDTSTKITVTKQ